MWILIFFFSLNASDFLAESVLGASPSPFRVTQITSWSDQQFRFSFSYAITTKEKKMMQSNQNCHYFCKDFSHCSFSPSIYYDLFSFFSCNPMCAFLCTLFLHSSAVLFLISHPHSPMLPMFLCILGKNSQMYML